MGQHLQHEGDAVSAHMIEEAAEHRVVAADHQAADELAELLLALGMASCQRSSSGSRPAEAVGRGEARQDLRHGHIATSTVSLWAVRFLAGEAGSEASGEPVRSGAGPVQHTQPRHALPANARRRRRTQHAHPFHAVARRRGRQPFPHALASGFAVSLNDRSCGRRKNDFRSRAPAIGSWCGFSTISELAMAPRSGRSRKVIGAGSTR